MRINLYCLLLPVYKKELDFVLMHHQSIRKMSCQNIIRGMKVKKLDHAIDGGEKKLSIILPWLSAKEGPVEKYRNLYLSRGFDVLTVETESKDLLYPISTSQVKAHKTLNYLSTHTEYEKILIHAFSVGGYIMGEMFALMRSNVDKYMDISQRIKGVVLDSIVESDNIINGLTTVSSSNRLKTKILEWYFATRLILNFNVSCKVLIKGLNHFHYTPLKCPALVYVSEIDKLGDFETSQLIAENWRLRGIDLKMKVFKDSKHVCHMQKYKEEYISELDKFIEKINLISISES